jgi:hypothetical protein
VKPGDLASWRTANLSSAIMVREAGNHDASKVDRPGAIIKDLSRWIIWRYVNRPGLHRPSTARI